VKHLDDSVTSSRVGDAGDVLALRKSAKPGGLPPDVARLATFWLRLRREIGITQQALISTAWCFKWWVDLSRNHWIQLSGNKRLSLPLLEEPDLPVKIAEGITLLR